MDTQIFTLSNGLRVVIRHTSSVVSYIGVAVNAGSRDEDLNSQGLAHFVEHTLFKGTLNRKAFHISNRMESIGGELNAYTSKEETLLYTGAPAGYAPRALQLLADIIANSTFPDRELSMEREVVIEEINSYLDSPDELIYDEFEELIYSGSALAHNILGSPDSVRALSSADCRAFIDRFYTPANMALYIADPGDPQKLLRQVEKHFGHLHFPSPNHSRIAPPPIKPFDVVHDRNGHQSHTIIGTRLFGRNDPRRFALFLLNNYLGGPCMNSLLNRELREKRGLVYTADSNVALLSDTGSLMIYFGTDRESTPRCRQIIANILDSLAQNLLPDNKFNAIKEQYCGQIIMSTDHKESMAMAMGKSLLYYNSIHDPSATAEKVRSVTPAQLREVAELCASNCSRITIQ